MVSDEVHKSDINKGLQYINFSPLKVFMCIVPTDESFLAGVMNYPPPITC